MVYMFVFGPAIVTVRYWEEARPSRGGRRAPAQASGARRGQEVGGARVEVRRAGEVIGEQRRTGDGVIWRCDLPAVPPGGDAHHRPAQHDGEGTSVLRWLDTAPSADPVAWAITRLADISALLVDGGAADIADQVDAVAVERALPAIRSAILACLDQAPRRTATL